MAPRRENAEWLPSSGASASISRPVARLRASKWCLHVAHGVMMLLCLCAVSLGRAAAAGDAAESSHFSGLRVISGSSFRAFSNRFRRQLRGRQGGTEGDCLSFHEAGNWWRYEWCVGRHVRQFHGDWSIVLGRFGDDASKSMRILRVDDPDARSNPDLRGYHGAQQYPRGDVCDATQAPRETTVRYKCCVFRANETYIEAVDEPAPCAYTLSVCTPAACGLMQRDQYVFGASPHVSDEERLVLAATVKDMFYHAYHGYMDHAFPLDALLPLSCRGETFELGKIPMLTLIDTLDTLAILQDAAEFQRAVALVAARADFDLDTEVSVFETTIRVLGGLLAAHLFAVDASLGLFPAGQYQNELLALAVDLGDRLLPAFNTSTGIPYGTVNLRSGVPPGETPIASTAGAGSLSMEFTMLSALTGDAAYATASRRAVRALFARRSQLGLLGKHIDTATGEWTETASGVGSNSDSFYEYLWKMYATFGDTESLAMFERVYAAVVDCNLHGDWFADVSMWSGCAHGGSGVVFENLAAFWPGMQASLGHVAPAARSMNAIYRVWREYGFVPEQFNVLKWKPVRGGGARYPLRPELIESTFYMHEATNDSSWLRAGAHFVHSLQKHTKTTCGYATVRDVESKELEDNMPSFFLSETCKYLYLLFNTTHFLRNGSYVFTTEAHPFPVLPARLVAPVLVPTMGESHEDEAAAARPSLRGQCTRPAFWHALGYQLDYEGVVTDRTVRCARPTSSHRAGATTANSGGAAVDWLPQLEQQLQAALRADGEVVELGFRGEPTDELMARVNAQLLQSAVPPPDAASQLLNGGPRLGLFRMDQSDAIVRFTRQDTGEWVESTGVEDARFTVLSWRPERRAEQEPSEDEDDELPLLLPRHRVYDYANGRRQPALRRLCSVQVHVPPVPAAASSPSNPYTSTPLPPTAVEFSCAGSSFGAMPVASGGQRTAAAPLALAEPLDACVPLRRSLHGRVAVVARGACFFETKVRNAAAAGAVGVVVVNDEDEDRVMVMSGSGEAVHAASDPDPDPDHDHGHDEQLLESDGDHKTQSVAIPAVMVPRRAGEWLDRQLRKHSGVAAEIRLALLDREQDVAQIHAYLDAVDAVANAGGDEADEDEHAARRRHVASLAQHVFPRMERIASGHLGGMTMYAPEWGVHITPVNKPRSQEIGSWLLEIEARPQTREAAASASP